MSAGAPPSSPDPLSSRVVAPPSSPADPLSSPIVAPPSTPDPLSSPIVAPSDPVAMPTPPSSPPAVAEDEDEDQDQERPWPTIKMKLFPYAVYCVFGGMGRTGENLLLAFLLLQYLLIISTLLSFYTDGGQARFWELVSRVAQHLCTAFTTFITCAFIRYYMRVDGEYNETYYPPQQRLAPAPAAEQLPLPSPPPEMDMC